MCIHDVRVCQRQVSRRMSQPTTYLNNLNQDPIQTRLKTILECEKFWKRAEKNCTKIWQTRPYRWVSEWVSEWVDEWRCMWDHSRHHCLWVRVRLRIRVRVGSSLTCTHCLKYIKSWSGHIIRKYYYYVGYPTTEWKNELNWGMCACVCACVCVCVLKCGFMFAQVIRTNAYEQAIAGELIDPAELSVSFDDIGWWVSCI